MKLILNHIKEKLGKGNYLFEKESDVFFITRFKSSNLLILLINDKWYALTDQRYFNSIKKELTNFKVIDIMKNDWIKNIKDENNFNSIYIDSSYHSIESFNLLKKIFKENKVQLKTKNFGYIRDIYLKKDINNLKKSININDQIFLKIKKKIKIGMTERQIYKLIMIEIIKSKADKESFEPIVAAGKNGANPHHHASKNKKLKENEMLTIDMGIFYKGLASDMTRTFVVSGKLTQEENDIWYIVKKTMESCISMIKPGVKTKDLHIKAQEIIKNSGYEGYFNHGLGHGLGVEIHDYPTINPYSKDILNEGMIITIEPGIYIPNKCGVRIEQNVLVTKNGHKILQKTPIKLY